MNLQPFIQEQPFIQVLFYECFLNRHNRFRVFHISSEEVIKNREIKGAWTEEKRGLAIQHLEDEKNDMTELQYGQEYLALFQDDMRRFYSDNWIDEICVLKRNDPSPKQDNYMGCDLARMGGDKTTYADVRI